MVGLRRSAPEKAVTNLSITLSLALDDGVILSKLGGTAYYLRGNTAKAIVYLTRALARNPGDEQSRYYLELTRRR